MGTADMIKTLQFSGQCDGNGPMYINIAMSEDGVVEKSYHGLAGNVEVC